MGLFLAFLLCFIIGTVIGLVTGLLIGYSKGKETEAAKWKNEKDWSVKKAEKHE